MIKYKIDILTIQEKYGYVDNIVEFKQVQSIWNISKINKERS